MRVELLPGMTNLVRFPVEHRGRHLRCRTNWHPMCAAWLILPEMSALDLHYQVDAETAGYIVRQLPRHGAERDAMLAELLGSAVSAAGPRVTRLTRRRLRSRGAIGRAPRR
jgi:hypothetical protein